MRQNTGKIIKNYITENVGLGIVTVFGGYVTSLTASSTRRNFSRTDLSSYALYNLTR